jgi:hypothetical protein
VFGFRNAGADKDGGVNGGPFLFMMKPSISLSRPGGQILAVCVETRVSKISDCQQDQRSSG